MKWDVYILFDEMESAECTNVHTSNNASTYLECRSVLLGHTGKLLLLLELRHITFSALT